ncbi:hypothetical protein KSP39_PZI011980 [Platanthera zijinensis]|uniref:Uncharacterized protein n=1 Tax=Platanthera zijinensis TaxID=2320716 RepID=A0AAP0BFM7_9ASPA
MITLDMLWNVLRPALGFSYSIIITHIHGARMPLRNLTAWSRRSIIGKRCSST